MFKFGFRATVNFAGTPKNAKEDGVQPVSTGVYRAYKEEFYGNYIVLLLDKLVHNHFNILIIIRQLGYFINSYSP